MRRQWQGGRVSLFLLLAVASAAVIGLSSAGVLSPLENIAAAPLNWLSGLFTRVGMTVSGSADAFEDIDTLRQRNADLEEALARLTSEVVSLREIGSDYYRLAELVAYTTTVDNQEFVTADVINRDTASSLRTIVINRGTRDGVRNGMPVVTGQGLVGRVINVGANVARVMLVNSEASAVSGRLQTTRAEGAVLGLDSGNMRMSMLDQDAEIVENDLVITSGLGGNLPPDLVIGQVSSIRRFESGTEQTAEIRSLIDFDTLEMVMVITSFEPVDLSIFEQEAGN